MKKMIKIAGGIALASVAAMPALAGGLSAPAEEPAPVVMPVTPVVSGSDWTGGYVGGQLGYGDISATGLDGDGILGGVHAGYDWDFGNWVVGAGIDHDIADIDLGNGAGSLDSVTRLKLRAGADLGQTLLYGTAGAAHARADVGGSNLSDDGWFVGIGADYRLTDSWTVGGEVLTHQFDNFDGSGVDIDATTATLRASFRF